MIQLSEKEKAFIEQKFEEIEWFCNSMRVDGEPHLGLDNYCQPTVRSCAAGMVLAAKLLQFFRCTDRNEHSEKMGRLAQDILDNIR